MNDSQPAPVDPPVLTAPVSYVVMGIRIPYGKVEGDTIRTVEFRADFGEHQTFPGFEWSFSIILDLKNHPNIRIGEHYTLNFNHLHP